MPRQRTKRSQTHHDQAVKKRADQLKRQGFNVRADIPHFPQPGTIGGVRPDIDARKGRRRVIVEVETPESADDRRAQRQAREFQRAANRSRSTTFEQITTRPRK